MQENSWGIEDSFGDDPLPERVATSLSVLCAWNKLFLLAFAPF